MFRVFQVFRVGGGIVVIEGEGGKLTMDVQRIEQHPSAAGDIALNIGIEASGFSGHGLSWVCASAATRFLIDIRQLEVTRHGSATLDSISPHQFTLAIKSVDVAGHMAILARLQQQAWSRDRRSYSHVVEVGFEFDPSLLPSVISQFASWLDGSLGATG